uniref:Uncharacterized protein n=1 Tax=Hyaloperonospora arabidopsidis (strain Emoy2) TaxID=559515 RepID=M4BYN6_HYAAE
MMGVTLWLGEYDHISKCWTLISKGRPRYPSILYCVNTYITASDSFFSVCRCIDLFNLITYIKGRAPELAPLSYLKSLINRRT